MREAIWFRNGGLWAASFTTLVACASSRKEPETAPGGQTYEQAVEILCTVDQRAGITPEDNPIQTSRRRWDFIEQRVKHPHAIYHSTLLQVESGEEQARSLRALAKEAGIADCPMAKAAAEQGI